MNVTLPTMNALSVLAQASATMKQLVQKQQINLISVQLQKQLNRKIAALQNNTDTSVIDFTQSQLDNANKQLSAVTATQQKYAANATTLSNVTTQLTAMQTAVANGDAAAFDTALDAANTAVNQLLAITLTPPYQADGVASLKSNGLGIDSSSSYDLSTPSGQAAAQAIVQSAQDLVNSVSQRTTNNNTVATTNVTALSGQVNALNTHLKSLQDDQQAASTAQITQMMAQEQNQLHLIELALGNSQMLSDALAKASTPPQPIQSVFGVLTSAIGGSSSPYGTQQSAPAILSLLT
jgi:hypothetical protein